MCVRVSRVESRRWTVSDEVNEEDGRGAIVVTYRCCTLCIVPQPCPLPMTVVVVVPLPLLLLPLSRWWPTTLHSWLFSCQPSATSTGWIDQNWPWLRAWAYVQVQPGICESDQTRPRPLEFSFPGFLGLNHGLYLGHCRTYSFAFRVLHEFVLIFFSFYFCVRIFLFFFFFSVVFYIRSFTYFFTCGLAVYPLMSTLEEFKSRTLITFSHTHARAFAR